MKRLVLKRCLIRICYGHITSDLLNDSLNTILCSVKKSLRLIVLMDERVLLNRDLSVMTRHHLSNFILFDLLLPRRLRAFRAILDLIIGGCFND